MSFSQQHKSKILYYNKGIFFFDKRADFRRIVHHSDRARACVVILAIILDVTFVAEALLAAPLLYSASGDADGMFPAQYRATPAERVLVPLSIVAVQTALGAFKESALLSFVKCSILSLIALSATALLLSIQSLFAYTHYKGTYGIIGIWLALSIVGLLWLWYVYSRLMQHLERAGIFAQRVAVVAFGDKSLELVETLSEPRRQRSVRVAGIFSDSLEPGHAAPSRIPILGGIDALPCYLRDHELDAVIVAMERNRMPPIGRTLEGIRRLPVDVRLAVEYRHAKSETRSGNKVRSEETGKACLGNFALYDVARRPLTGANGIAKRAEDIAISCVLLVLLGPLMILITASIKLTSKGSVFFRQERFGLANQVIRVWKFRTMHVGLSDPTGAHCTVRNDTRVTPFGYWLRRFSLDELPQLFNVLRGEMSLVGPRAHAVTMRVENRLYHDAFPEYEARHWVLPGITGLAQVNGHRGEVKTLARARERLELDLCYIE